MTVNAASCSDATDKDSSGMASLRRADGILADLSGLMAAGAENS